MTKLVFAESFIENMTQVELESKRDEIFGRIELLADFPELGSSNLPKSICDNYGPRVRKLVVNPFDVVYEYDEVEDAAHILGLVHQRAAY